MNIKIKTHIKMFIQNIKKQYKDIIINYHYEKDEDVYLIYHNNSELEYNDSKFLKFAGGLLREQFIENEIYNIGFGYDYEFDIKTKSELKDYDWLNSINNSVDYNYINVEKHINYNSNIKVDNNKNFLINQVHYNKIDDSFNKSCKYNINSQSDLKEYSNSIFSNKDEWSDVA